MRRRVLHLLFLVCALCSCPALAQEEVAAGDSEVGGEAEGGDAPEVEGRAPLAPGETGDAPVPSDADEPSVDEPSVDEPSVEEPSVEEPSVEEPSVEESEEADAGLVIMLRADQAGRLRFESDDETLEFPAPGRATLEPATYRVSWVPQEGDAEVLRSEWQATGDALHVAHRGPSFTNLLGYWLFANGLLVGVPVSAGVFAKRDDLGTAATFSIIGVNTLVAIAGAILMGVGDDEVIELQ